MYTGRNEIVQRRVIGAAALIAVGILIPVLLVWCSQTGTSVRGKSVRVYNITPSGQAVPVRPNGTGEQGDHGAPTPTGNASRPAAPGTPKPAPPPPEIAPRSASKPKPQPKSKATQSRSKPAAGAPSAKAVHSGDWIVQVGSFSEHSNASRFVAKLEKNFPAYVDKTQVKGKTYYRVRVGPYPSKARADDAAGVLDTAGYNTQVQQSK